MPSANKTPNIKLNQWQGNEYLKRQDLVDDNKIIDAEIQTIKNTVNNLELTASNVTIADATNVFTATDVEGALLENKTSILSLTESVNGAKSKLATECSAFVDLIY